MGSSSVLLLVRRPEGVPRRRVLGLGAALGLLTVGALTGCQEPAPAAAPPPLVPDELSVNRAVETALTLHTQALTLAAQTQSSTAALLRRMAAVHEAHLTALGAPLPATPSATPSPSATAPPDPKPAGPTALAKAEATAARVALRDALAADGPFAVLLARIAAARVVNADLLNAALHRKVTGTLKPAAAPKPSATSTPGETASATGEPSAEPGMAGPEDSAPGTLRDPDSPTLTAVDRLLAGEHAAVFVYPLIVARVAADRRDLALSLWQEHRNTRDALAVQLQSAGVQPSVSAPAYAVGKPPTSTARAASLAARIERGLAALATDLLAAGAPGDAYRTQGAAELVLAARRTANWSNRPDAFPGLTTTASPTPTVSSTATAPPTPVRPTTISIAPDRPTIFPELSTPGP